MGDCSSKQERRHVKISEGTLPSSLENKGKGRVQGDVLSDLQDSVLIIEVIIRYNSCNTSYR